MTTEGIIPTAFKKLKPKRRIDIDFDYYLIVDVEQLQQKIIAEIKKEGKRLENSVGEEDAYVISLKALLGTESEAVGK